MKRMSGPCVVVILAALAGPVVAAGAEPIAVSGRGWTVAADAARAILSLSHDRLGIVMKEIRLEVREETDFVPSAGWEVERTAAGDVLIRTEKPKSVWRLRFLPDTVKISCVPSRGRLTGIVPAPPERFPARILDPRGTPVDWVGTDEVVKSFGGSETRRRSFLPARNPDVMTFSLGKIAGAELHSLFDRRTDTVIDFPEGTRLQRDPGDNDVLAAGIAVPGNAAIRIIPDYFTAVLGLPFYVPFDDSSFPTPPLVWCSWTSYYHEAREDDIVRNTDWLAARLRPYGFGTVQIDSGYDLDETGRHFWIEKWKPELFPHGPAWLARHIKSRGLRPGLWLVPNSYGGAVESHPDWYLRDAKGGIVRNYGTAALDSSHPEVLDFLRKLFATLRDWGYEYFKFDGEHAMPLYAPVVDRSRLHDPDADPIAVYRHRLAVIREAVGPGTFIEGCPAGAPINGVGFFNSCFTGHDVYNSWQGMYPLFSSISANAFLNHLVFYVMPGEGIEVGPPLTVDEAGRRRVPDVVDTARSREDPLRGFGVTLPEARTLVSWVSLTGVAYPLASIGPELPEERVRLLEMTMPPLPIFPVDLFSRGTDMKWNLFKATTPDEYMHDYPEILDLKVNAVSGIYDVVALTNWRSAADVREIGFREKLGLDSGASYVAFDFWERKLLGVFKDRMRVAVEPHDTRVVSLHPAAGRPQLVGLSRHISGAHSLVGLSWDAASGRLRGTSEGVPGKPYDLYIRVPDGWAVTGASAREALGRPLAVQRDLRDELLSVGFEGRAKPVEWEVSFRPMKSGSAGFRP